MLNLKVSCRALSASVRWALMIHARTILGSFRVARYTCKDLVIHTLYFYKVNDGIILGTKYCYVFLLC